MHSNADNVKDLPDDAQLLRYMSFAKFVAMLSSRSLHLSRLDALGDKDRFEGSLPRGQHERLVRELIRELESNPPPELLEARKRWQNSGRDVEWAAEAQLRAYTLALRSSTYVSCWSQGPESEAMWRLYCEGHEGVAMVTTLAKLRHALADADVIISPVRYIDYRQEALPGRDHLQQLIHKRVAFEHEREVRVLHRAREPLRIGLPFEPAESGPLNKSISWDAERALDCLILSPFAPDWYPDAVSAVVMSFAPALADRTKLSELGADPVF